MDNYEILRKKRDKIGKLSKIINFGRKQLIVIKSEFWGETNHCYLVTLGNRIEEEKGVTFLFHVKTLGEEEKSF